MFGEKAIELVKEASRGQEVLGPFNEEKVRSVLEEMRVLFDSNLAEMDEYQALSPAIHLRHSSIERNRRCLLAYINSRVEQIQEMRWQFGAVLPKESKDNLCEPEFQFFRNYSRDLANYMKAIGNGSGLDLMTDLKPPKSLFIEVRCKEDFGEMETEDGDLIVLKKNTQHFLSRNFCEPLIRQGILEHISH